jgi:hypothetical protein
VSVNWHLATDATGGWSARITLFNWEDSDMRDWFSSVVLDDKVFGGFEQAYSFNATAAGNGTIFMRGREGFDDLIRESNMSGVDYPVPGKQQSVLSFTKIDNGKFWKGYLTRKRTWWHQTEEDKKSNISQQDIQQALQML